jgi:hypothetical protein
VKPKMPDVKIKTGEVKTDLKRLNQLIATFSEANNLAVKVGILAEKNSRVGGVGESNASIGLVHEFGSYVRHIPERSFIRMPLHKKQGEMIREIQRIIGEHLFTGIRPFLKKVGMVAEGAIGEAFATGGFGSWDAISKKTEKRKGSDAILIETSQLQRSITSKVVRQGE